MEEEVRMTRTTGSFYLISIASADLVNCFSYIVTIKEEHVALVLFFLLKGGGWVTTLVGRVPVGDEVLPCRTTLLVGGLYTSVEWWS